jgi:hypothetical protein
MTLFPALSQLTATAPRGSVGVVLVNNNRNNASLPRAGD